MDFQVYAQSNIFPRMLVYDSTAQPGALSKLVDLGYEIQSNGVTLYKSPQQPTLSPVVQLTALSVVVGLIGWLLLKAIK
jgi:hypothetical protein